MPAPGVPQVRATPDVVSLVVVLPPLLYAASEELPWRDLRAVRRPVAVLAVGLVLASAAAVAAVAGAAPQVAGGGPDCRSGFRSVSAAAGSPQWQATIAAYLSSGAAGSANRLKYTVSSPGADRARSR